jgi:nitroimidazol reductase NimA-like FMN-containing flavoprotein (pyridoxamine 5'-phosphate oxidase superfamily)
MKIRMLRVNPEVCFEVDHVDSLSNWQSVIAWGRFEELEGEEANLAEQQLIERIRPLLGAATDQPPHAQSESGRQRAICYRIALAERTGRYEQH